MKTEPMHFVITEFSFFHFLEFTPVATHSVNYGYSHNWKLKFSSSTF